MQKKEVKAMPCHHQYVTQRAARTDAGCHSGEAAGTRPAKRVATSGSIARPNAKHAAQKSTSRSTYPVDRSALFSSRCLGTAAWISFSVTVGGAYGRLSLSHASANVSPPASPLASRRASRAARGGCQHQRSASTPARGVLALALAHAHARTHLSSYSEPFLNMCAERGSKAQIALARSAEVQNRGTRQRRAIEGGREAAAQPDGRAGWMRRNVLGSEPPLRTRP